MYEEPTPPLKWHGGKHYLAKRIVGLSPAHKHYVEPFAGGLAVLLAHSGEGRSELINDLDGQLINFFRVLQHPQRFEQFRRIVEAISLARDEWEQAHRHEHGRDAVADAAAFFVDCRQSWAGERRTFTAPTRTRTRRGRNGNVSEWVGAVEGLAAIHARLWGRVFIENLDAMELIPREDKPDTLFYCDPPYSHETRTTTNSYRCEMTEADHRQLLDVLRSVKGKVMLSGYSCPLYNEALTDWNLHDFDMPNHASGGKNKRRMTERLWCNF